MHLLVEDCIREWFGITFNRIFFYFCTFLPVERPDLESYIVINGIANSIFRYWNSFTKDIWKWFFLMLKISNQYANKICFECTFWKSISKNKIFPRSNCACTAERRIQNTHNNKKHIHKKTYKNKCTSSLCSFFIECDHKNIYLLHTCRHIT